MSVFLTVRNEERDLEESIEHILEQDYPGPLEVVVAVGPSSDRTEEIAASIARAEPRVVVVANPTGKTPAGLNRAVAAAQHDLLVRVDGHSVVPHDYVSTAVAALASSGAANVGGLMRPEGRTALEMAIARAMSSPLGIGSVSFHTGGAEGPSDSVYLGSFRRDALESVGGFDEEFLRAQDWELNYRLRRAGHVVWFDPRLSVGYRPRGSWKALAEQFYRSGRWRRHVMQRYPETASARYLAPPVAVGAMVVGAAAGVVGLVAGLPWAIAGFLVPATYAVGVVAGSVAVGSGLPVGARLRLPGVVATMHLCWGGGFLRGPEPVTPEREPATN